MSASSGVRTDVLVGIGISTSAEHDPLVEAQQAEVLGFDFVSASDHPIGTHPTYETLALLTWIAANTERIRIATRVLGAPFRRPVMLAKSAESIQRLSGGRLILGLGGGYSDEEIAAVGAGRLTPGEKVAGLADAITTMRAAWAGELIITPTPSSPIPIWLGTYGPRALAVTGGLADGWIPSLGHAAPASIPPMLERIRAAAVDAGRAADAVLPVYNVPVRLARRGIEDGVVTGSAADVVEQLESFRRLGFRGFNLMTDDGQARAVAEEILPALRAGDR